MTEPSTGALAAGDGFRVGRVLSRSFALLMQNFGKFYLLGLLAALPVTLLQFQNVVPLRVQRPLPAHATGHYVWLGILVLVLQAVGEAVVIYGAFQAMRGRTLSVGESITRALQRLIPIVGTGLLQAVAFVIGLTLLVVPGIVFLTMFLVAMPICVVEALGPVRSLGRSRELTKGNRWRVFGLYVVVSLLTAVPRFPIGYVATAVGGTTAAGIVGYLYSAGVMTFKILTIVVAYHELRVAKEGMDVERIASVFD
jgi:hypothetical protein